MKVWVTGIAGAVGSHAAERLLRAGHEVSGVDAFTPYYDPRLKQATARELEAQGIGITRADLTEDDVASLIPEGTDYVFQFAAQPGISATTPFADYLRNNIVATERLLDAAESLAGLRGFVFISTSSVYGARANGSEETAPTPTSVYGATKLAAEQLTLARARERGFPAASLRFFSVYGERERPEKLFRKLVPMIDAGKPFPLHEGSERHVRSFTYVGDAVESCVAAIDRFDAIRGEAINIGSDQTATTGEAIKIVERLMGKEARFEILPPRPGDQRETAADIAKARKLLGYAPQTSLEEGLAREVAWCRALKA